jgi:hypothetical protein
MDYYNVSLHDFFFMTFFLFFFQNDLCQFCFVIVFFKTLWIVTIFIHMVLFCYSVFPYVFFSKLSLSNFFLILSWLRITIVDFPTCFFPKIFSSFFLFFFQNFFCWFYFFNMELVENLALYFFSLKHCELLQCFPTWFFFLFLFFFQNCLCWFYFFHIELVNNLAS